VITLSILSIRADGTLCDELNYEWISDNKQIEDLVEIKLKLKLKIKKYRNEIKAFDLNRQQIKSWVECEEIISHFYQIKDYL
jgi:hypothetical protein